MTSGNVAQNRKARFSYILEDEYEAGVALVGSELKSIRAGKVNLNDAYIAEKDSELYLLNAHIAEYHSCGNYFNHKPKRERKLLLHRQEINKLIGKTKIRGYTIVPLAMYINRRNLVKIKIALAKGKHLYDKRNSLKERDLQRDREVQLKERLQ